MAANSHIGSSLDDFLEEDGILSEVNTIALKRVLSWQIAQAMETKGVNKESMADAMDSHLTVLDELLDPDNMMVTLQTIDHAASVLGKQLRIELIDAS